MCKLKIITRRLTILFCCLCFLMVFENSRAEAQNSPIYQLTSIPNVLVYTDPDINGYTDPPRAIIVDKEHQQISLYCFNGYWKNEKMWPCSTGKKAGPKNREGDQRTPEGVYFATRNVGQRYLSNTYGSRALPLDYPNWLDRRLKRSGSAIWLHGTNKPLQARDTNGCVVINNEDIDQLSRLIHLHQTPVIIVDRNRLWSMKEAQDESDRILAAANQWHNAMMHGDYQTFSQWYASGNRPSMKWWQKWSRQRRKLFKNKEFTSRINHRAIYRSGDCFILLFDHYLVAGDNIEWAGRRKFYLDTEQDHISIIGDTFQTYPVAAKDPLLYAGQKLWQKDKQRCKVVMIKKKKANNM